MTTINTPEPTRKQFMAYRRVQETGRYNMIMDADKASKAAGLTLTTYFAIINRYNELYDKYIRASR